VARRFAEFQGLGVGVVAVSMSRPDAITRYLAEQPLPFPALSDVDRKAYAAFGLGRTTIGRLIRPGIGWRYLKGVMAGGRIHRIPEGEDALQTGGDFLIGFDRRLQWAHTTPDPTGRPGVAQLLAEARRQFVTDTHSSR
jgi:AhpC/TSA antioxidant enzyme